MSRIEIGEIAKSLGDEIPDAKILCVEVVLDQLSKLRNFS
jgi:hypothetical protein